VGVRLPPRFPLAVLPTPLVRAHRLEAALRCGPVLLKRDDLAGFAAAGNKTRPLEYLVGAALAEGADVLVTGGGPGSNFCPAAALAARAAGLDCELVVWGDVAGSANLALAAAAGARLQPTGEADREAVDTLVDSRAAPTALIVLAVGSGGSVAGLVTGLAAVGLAWPVLGVSVSRPLLEITDRVTELAGECAALLAAPVPPPPELVDARGAGFGVASPQERGCARLALHTEGMLLDDTYGAEAFTVLVDRVRADQGGPVVYWHTGGLIPAIATLTEAG